MKRIAPLLLMGALVSTGLLAGCDSQASLIANPATEGKISTVPATLTVAPTGAMTLFFPQATLTDEMKQASSLKILLGSTPVPMTKVTDPAEGVTAPVPQGMGLDPDLAGTQNFVFILDRAKSQVVKVAITSAP
jgi:hypothetical protein